MRSSDTDPVASVLDRLRASLERARLASNRPPIVAAVSGGADSLCLLDAAVTVRGSDRPNLVVGHVDHQLRTESAEDAAHVRAAAERYGVPCEIVPVDTPALARAERRGVEEAARIGRYRALGCLARKVGAVAILTGHTRSDSVETVLLHLLRGSGPRGLRGIQPVERLDAMLGLRAGVSRAGRPVGVVRPLLEVDRAETAAYCQARGIEWRVDTTNADPSFARNRVRQHLLPVLRTYNPAADEALDRLAETVREEQRWIDAQIERTYRRLVQPGPDCRSFELRAWWRHPLAVQRRLVMRVADDYGIADVGFAAVERALAVTGPAGPSRVELGGGLTVEREDERLVFRHAASE